MSVYDREDFYEKVADVMSDFCSECMEHENYLEGTYREDIERNLCDPCYEEENVNC